MSAHLGLYRVVSHHTACWKVLLPLGSRTGTCSRALKEGASTRLKSSRVMVNLNAGLFYLTHVGRRVITFFSSYFLLASRMHSNLLVGEAN